jgi:pimeloyl-ACP methyl ester carboxylesterase
MVEQIDIGGRTLAAQIKGSGPTTVVLEVGAGGGGIGIAWNGVDDRIAQFARVVVYDRAGVGQSAPAPERFPTAGDRARDLAALLDGLNIREPVILAGWSLGGLIVEHFALLHPERVAGLLLIDPTPIDTFTAAPKWQRALMRSALPSLVFTSIARTGVFRTRRGRGWLQHMLEAQVGPKFDRSNLPQLVEIVGGPDLHRMVRMESTSLEQSCAEVAALLEKRGLPKVPTIVLTAELRGKAGSAMARASARVGASHAALAARTGGELRTLSGVSHSVPFEAPEAIVEAVRDLAR